MGVGGKQQLVVVGGGPAGAVSAILGCRDGLQVTLIAPETGRPRLEGLSPRLFQWLQGQGLLEGFSGIIGPLSRQVDWDGISESNREFVVERSALDAHLRLKAEAAGAVRIDSTARIEAENRIILNDGTRMVADWIIDARGRAAKPASDARFPATIALCGWMQVDRAAAGIRITALPQGWLWRVALPDGRVWAQFTGDAASDLPARDRLLQAFHAAEPELHAVDLAGPLIAREAAPHLPLPVDNLRCVAVGDALAAMDPLSGHGQFWAVSSALAVAAARRTLIADPAAEGLCKAFLDHRAVETAWRMGRMGRDFLRAEGRYREAGFWRLRRDLPDDAPINPPSAGFTIKEAPVVKDGLVAMAEILVTPRSPNGVGWFGSIPAGAAYRSYLEGPQALGARFGAAAAHVAKAIEAEAVPLY